MHTALLYLMGYVASLNGKVDEDQAQQARIVIVNCVAGSGGQTDCQRLFASFERGVAHGGEWGEAAQTIRRAWDAGIWSVDFRPDVLNALALMANLGSPSPAQHQTLIEVAEWIDLPWDDFPGRVRVLAGPVPAGPDLATARALLGVSPTATHRELGRAYRRTRSNYFRLRLQNLPPEFRAVVQQNLQTLEEGYVELRAAAR